MAIFQILKFAQLFYHFFGTFAPNGQRSIDICFERKKSTEIQLKSTLPPERNSNQHLKKK